MFNTVSSLYLFSIAFTLALLEIQIEGAHGWAEKLPTWRYDRPWFRSLTDGKTLTAYHLFLHMLLLLLFHLPVFFTSWSWMKELQLLSAYILLSLTWDFLWFLWNPAYGIRRFRAGEVWWFRYWFLGLPVDYWLGFGVSLGLAFIAGQALAWAKMLLCFIALIAVCGMVVSFRRTSKSNTGG